MTRFEDAFQLICEFYTKQGMCSQQAIHVIKDDYVKKLQEVEEEISTIERFTHHNRVFVNKRAIESALIRHMETVDGLSARLAVCLELQSKGGGLCHSVCLYTTSKPINA